MVATYVPFTAGKLNQKVTWWAISGNDGTGGNTFAAPILIDARWEEYQETFRSPMDARELVSQAVVYVDRDMAEGDYLCQADQTGQNDPTVITGAFKIQKYLKSPDLRAADNVRKAIL